MSEAGAAGAAAGSTGDVRLPDPEPGLGRIAHPIIFIRHGETDWNRELRLQGQQDIPLNALGRRQAARNGRAIAGILDGGQWARVSSPLLRTVETTRIVLDAAGRTGHPFRTDAEIRELSYGAWEGLTLPELEAHDPLGMAAREREKWTYVPPGGESYAMLAARVAGWLATLGAPSLVIAHGGILRVLLHLLAGQPAHDAPHLAAPQDRVILFTRRAVLTI